MQAPEHPAGRAALALAAAVLLAGCAHQRFTNPTPPGATAPLCQGLLDEGHRCQVVVHADQMATSTTLVVMKGQRYQVQVAPDQRWCDASHCSTAPLGDAGNKVMNALHALKRDKDADWLQLMAAVVRDSEGRHRLGGGQPVASDPVVEVQHTGVLALYPNDVPGMYWNNRGDVLACIERLAPGAAPATQASDAASFCPARR
jgi:hypothetical protein